MAIIDDVLKKLSPNKKSNVSDNNLPILGRKDTYTADEDVIDDELPSVNRRRAGNNLAKLMGYVFLLGGGAAMLYFIYAPKTVEQVAPKKWNISSNLPVLEKPDPPAPPPLPADAQVTVPTINGQAPIPIQNTTQQTSASAPDGPRPFTWLDRKMGGGAVMSLANDSNITQPSNLQQVARASANNTQNPGANTWLGAKLKSTVTPEVSAQMLPDRDYLITKGTALDCALETAIDSSLSGLTTCRLTRDVYSDNGHVVLLDRGSQLVGEYQGGLMTGQVRIFLLWTRAKTPNGVVVSLDSPGTDALGRTGNSGFVDTHFMERFGAAILFSLVQDGLALAQKNNNTSINIGGGQTGSIATEILKNQINIPPTLYVNQGAHVQIMVARDLDFSSVYELALNEQ